MMGHNIRLKGEIWKLIPKLSLLPLLMLSTANIFREDEAPLKAELLLTERIRSWKSKLFPLKTGNHRERG